MFGTLTMRIVNSWYDVKNLLHEDISNLSI